MEIIFNMAFRKHPLTKFSVPFMWKWQYPWQQAPPTKIYNYNGYFCGIVCSAIRYNGDLQIWQHIHQKWKWRCLGQPLCTLVRLNWSNQSLEHDRWEASQTKVNARRWTHDPRLSALWSIASPPDQTTGNRSIKIWQFNIYEGISIFINHNKTKNNKII